MDVYEGKENYIFISYAHKDSATVVPILETMMKNGFRLWYDLGIEAGTEWPEYIAEHLEGSRTVISFMSNYAANSRNCRNEINEALSLDKDTLVIYLNETTLTPGMRLQLNSTQSMFYYHHDSMESFITALLKARILKDCRDESVTCVIPGNGVTYRPPAYKAPSDLGQVEPPKKAPAATVSTGSTDTTKPAVTPTEPVPEAEQLKMEQAQGKGPALTADQLYQIGVAYTRGVDTKRDYAEAELWYRMAYKKGSAEAANALGNLYCEGVFGIPEYVKAMAWYHKAVALNGLPAAYYNLGKCYSNGYGVEEDSAAAFNCYLKAFFKLGRVIGGFFKGMGNAGKRKKALKLVEEALK